MYELKVEEAIEQQEEMGLMLTFAIPVAQNFLDEQNIDQRKLYD